MCACGLERAACCAGVPWQLRRTEVRGVLGFDEVGAAAELPSPDRGFSDTDSPRRPHSRRPRRLRYPRIPGASTMTMSSGPEGDGGEGGSAGVGSCGGGGASCVDGSDREDGGTAPFLWNSADDLLWSEDERVLLPMPGFGGLRRSSPDL